MDIRQNATKRQNKNIGKKEDILSEQESDTDLDDDQEDVKLEEKKVDVVGGQDKPKES